MQWLYLSALVVSISGLAVLDWRHKIAFWYDAKRTALTVSVAVGIFIIWDALGIALGIFFRGGSQYALPFNIAPEFPIEELFFLVLLCYTTLMIYLGVSRWRRI